MDEQTREMMNIVIIGHVDHGKSTVIGRLLADTGSLPQGKLESVKEMCRKNSRPFEYAFLLDALKDEQSQGITIDSARCFFKTAKRDYIIIDAPGHIEFLKNMLSGAARAEAALLVIDSNEGIQENSKRHGYLLSLLGVRQVTVLINKMDLADYQEARFNQIKTEYSAFLNQIGVVPVGFIPISAREGDNMIEPSARMKWHEGLTVLGQLDAFRKEKSRADKPFRFLLQDIYKFTEDNDDRRIFAGRIESGSVKAGDEVAFYPSGKRNRIKSIEVFNSKGDVTQAEAGEVPGFTLETQIYVKPGEILCRIDQAKPAVSDRFKANLFWLGRNPMVMGKNYKLKLGTAKALVKLVEINNIIDASDLTTVENKQQIDLYDTAECIFETVKPIAFDPFHDIDVTGRFVIIDNYEITGGGIIMSPVTPKDRYNSDSSKALSWDRGYVTPEMREKWLGHKPQFIVITGADKALLNEAGKELEKKLFDTGRNTYYMGFSALKKTVAEEGGELSGTKEEILRRLGELAKIMTDAGVIFIATMDDLDDYDIALLKSLTAPHELVVAATETGYFTEFKPQIIFTGVNAANASDKVIDFLLNNEIIPDFMI